MGTGETTRRLIEAYPDAWVIGLDSSPDMVFRARENYDDVQLARMEDPLPDGPWDLVIGVLSIHHLRADQKQELFRRVRDHSRALVIGDVVKAEVQVTPIDAATTSRRTLGPSKLVRRRGHLAADDLAGRRRAEYSERLQGRPTPGSSLPCRADGRPEEENFQRPPRQAPRHSTRPPRRASTAARAATARGCRTGSARPAAPTPGARSSRTKSSIRRRPPQLRVAVPATARGDGRPRRLRRRAGIRRARRGRRGWPPRTRRSASASSARAGRSASTASTGSRWSTPPSGSPTTRTPVAAVRAKKEASVVRAAADVADGRSAALVSHGSTGATMAAATFGLRRLQGVQRPALAVQLPAPGKTGPLPRRRRQRRRPRPAPGPVRLPRRRLQRRRARGREAAGGAADGRRGGRARAARRWSRRTGCWPRRRGSSSPATSRAATCPAGDGRRRRHRRLHRQRRPEADGGLGAGDRRRDRRRRPLQPGRRASAACC